MSIQVRPLSFGLGGSVTGIDLSQLLSNEDFDAIQAAWMEHLVLVFPGQKLTEAQQVAFGRKFGQLDDHKAVPFYRHKDYPEIFLITNKKIGGVESQTRDTGRLWHSDHSFTTHPSQATMLYCREIPPVGGNTLFTNMYRAYDLLSDKLKEVLEPLEAVHSLGHYFDINPYAQARSAEQIQKMRGISPPVAQPVVRVHPVTGRRALFVSEAQTTHFVGMTPAESRGLLEHLFKVSVTPEITYRHIWSVGDLVMWDNRCTMHMAMADYSHVHPRHMHRLTVMGEECGRFLEPSSQATAAAH